MDKDIRIILIDDQELIRRGLRHMLEQEEDMEVVGDYPTAEEAFSKMAKLRPDIVLMDTQMPGMDGIEATRRLKRNGLHYDGAVIVLAESMDYQVKALEAGAARYLLKDIKCAELTQAIREVYWSKQSSEGGVGFVEETVELVIPPLTDAAQLLRFICQLEEVLDDNYASIAHMIGSWEWGTVITVLLQSTTLSALLDKLGNMPELEKLEEEPVARGTSSSYPRKFGVLPRLSISPSKRIRVTLKETSMAK